MPEAESNWFRLAQEFGGTGSIGSTIQSITRRKSSFRSSGALG